MPQIKKQVNHVLITLVHAYAHMRVHTHTHKYIIVTSTAHGQRITEGASSSCWTCCWSGGQDLSRGCFTWEKRKSWWKVVKVEKLTKNTEKWEYKRSEFSKSATVCAHFSFELSWKDHLLTHINPAAKLRPGPSGSCPNKLISIFSCIKFGFFSEPSTRRTRDLIPATLTEAGGWCRLKPAFVLKLSNMLGAMVMRGAAPASIDPQLFVWPPPATS